MKAKAIVAVVAVLFAGWMAGMARADFSLYGSEQLTVNTTHHQYGWLYNQSTATITGPGGVLYLYSNNTSTVNISGGTVSQPRAYDTSTVNMSGGSMSRLEAYDTSTVNISGGEGRELYAYESSTVKMLGGTVNDLRAYNSSAVDMSGGTAWTYLLAYDTSTVKMSGGAVKYHLSARHTSTVAISGGTVSWLFPQDSSTVNISGGTVYQLVPLDSSTVNVSGGTVVYDLDARNTSTVTFHGQDFILGTGLSLNGDRVLGTGTLSGKWFDGTAWAVNISRNDASATIRVVPEPATVSLLALGGLAVMRRRAKRLR